MMKPNQLNGYMVLERVKKPLSQIDLKERFEERQGSLLKAWEGYPRGTKVIFEKAGPSFEDGNRHFITVKASDIIGVVT